MFGQEVLPVLLWLRPKDHELKRYSKEGSFNELQLVFAFGTNYKLHMKVGNKNEEHNQKIVYSDHDHSIFLCHFDVIFTNVERTDDI